MALIVENILIDLISCFLFSLSIRAESRVSRENIPEIRRWVPATLRPQHGTACEETRRDEIFRKVSSVHS